MPHPELVMSVFLFLLATSGWCAAFYAVDRWRSGQEIASFEPRQPVPWKGLEVLPIVFLFGLQLAVTILHSNQVEPDPPIPNTEQLAQTLASGLMGNVIFSGIILAILILFRKVTPLDIGWSPRKIGRDTLLGIGGFLAIGFVIFILQIVLSGLNTDPKLQHPLVQAMLRDRSPGILCLAALSAIVVAPLCEEFLFRVVLQGYLEKRFRVSTGETAPAQWTWGHSLPIVMSAAFFAAIHLRFHDGVPNSDPIPLFVLALVLGYLYQQTHRIWPSIMLHATLNACSFGIALLQLFGGPAR
jgi:membrane protease YdiL (CAAX protease family)